MTIPDLFSRAVRQANGCLTIGRPSSQRYWVVCIDGRKTRAHIAAWESVNGAKPPGVEICHSCDNTRCIEPGHLFAGTHARNMADRDAKGRGVATGEQSPLSKLTTDKVLAIFNLMQLGEHPVSVAKEFSISVTTVNRIANRKTWRSVLARKRDLLPEREEVAA